MVNLGFLITSPELALVLITSGIGGGGVIAAYAAFKKLRPETNQILVTTANELVITQSSVIKDLRTEVAGLRSDLADMKAENKNLRDRVRVLERDRP